MIRAKNEDVRLSLESNNSAILQGFEQEVAKLRQLLSGHLKPPSHAASLTHSHCLPHTLSVPLSHTLSASVTHSHCLPHTLSVPLSHTLSASLTHSQCLPHTLPSLAAAGSLQSLQNQNWCFPNKRDTTNSICVSRLVWHWCGSFGQGQGKAAVGCGCCCTSS